MTAKTGFSVFDFDERERLYFNSEEELFDYLKERLENFNEEEADEELEKNFSIVKGRVIPLGVSVADERIRKFSIGRRKDE